MSEPLTDTHGRIHDYLRVSLTERCNLRCSYCMPADGVQLSPKSHLMTAEELLAIVGEFVKYGVKKVRLTGGEPLIRKDAGAILKGLSQFPIELAITSNGVIIEQFIPLFKEIGLKNINISIDSLQEEKFNNITRRNYFAKVWANTQLLLSEGFHLKLNAVLIKDFNDDEIIDFVELSRQLPLHVRFIEFMPFNGNCWDRSQTVSYQDILLRVEAQYPPADIERLVDAPNDTARNYRIEGGAGTFAVISSVTNPFCSTCNRLRLTANGRIKNCLFSTSEIDFLKAYRNNESLEPLMQQAMGSKHKMRGGMDTDEKFDNPDRNQNNRSMILIGG